jgi:Uma2 family endonuclease
MTILSSTKQPLTAEAFGDFVHRPENANRWFELVRGEVIELPSPTRPHGVVCINVGYHLSAYLRQRGKGYVAGNDSGVILERDPDTVRGPDVAVYEDAERFEDLHPKYGEVPPRLAVEVLSPNDRADRVLRQINDYMRCGVGLLWVVDPEVRSVTVYKPGQPPVVVGADQELSGEDVLPGFACRVADLFYVSGPRAS